MMEEPSCNRRLVKGGTISDIIQKEAKKISSPVMSDFLIAARRGFTEQVLQGLKEGGSGKALSTDKHGRNCLQLATIHGHFETVHRILQTGLVDIDAVNKRGLTALHDACSEGYVRIGLLLLSMGACVRARTKDGWTCLMSACSNGYLKMAQMMLVAGCDIDTQTKLGLTALHIAAWKGHTAVVEMLLHEGCSPMALSQNSKTALQLAVEENQHECVTILTAASSKNLEDSVYRISSLEGQLRHCQNKLAESHRKFEAELVKQQLRTRETLETIQKEHEHQMTEAQQKIEILEKKLAEIEKEKGDFLKVTLGPSPTSPVHSSGPPSLQPKSPSSRRRKHLKKANTSLTPNTSKSELVPIASLPTNENTASSDTDVLSLKDRPKSSSYGNLNELTKEKHSSDSTLVKTLQLSPASSKKSTENRRDSGDKLTITALVAESLAHPGSISAIRKELKSDSFTPKIRRKFPNRSPVSSAGALSSISPKNGGGEGKEKKSPLSTRRDAFDRMKENNDKN